MSDTGQDNIRKNPLIIGVESVEVSPEGDGLLTAKFNFSTLTLLGAAKDFLVNGGDLTGIAIIADGKTPEIENCPHISINPDNASLSGNTLTVKHITPDDMQKSIGANCAITDIETAEEVFSARTITSPRQHGPRH